MTTYRCPCQGVEIGNHTETVTLDYPFFMSEYVGNRLKAGLSSKQVSVDKCIAQDVLFLWAHEIATYGSCCGHNQVKPMININPAKMGTAISLGFEPYVFKDDLDRMDTVYPMSIEERYPNTRRLNAAAPEMYESLKSIISYMQNSEAYDHEIPAHAWNKIHAAMRKAEGQET